MNKFQISVLLAVAMGATSLAACGGGEMTDGGTDGATDGAVDGGRDGGRDLGTDAGGDAGGDAGMDLGTDAGFDGGTDAGTDLGTDGGSDAGTDLGTDAGFDGGTDAGTDLGPMDLGVDMDLDGGFDAGFDAGFDMGLDGGPPPAGAYLRVANLVSNNNVGNVSFCLGDSAMGYSGTPLEEAVISDYSGTGLPYPAVSAYTHVLDATIALGTQLSLDDAATISSDCGRVGSATNFATVDPLTLVSGHTYTAAYVGLFDPGTGIPAVCGAAFSTACPAGAAARVIVFDDDVILPASGTKARVIHSIANAGNVDVCWDPDGVGAMPAVSLASNLAYGAASAYATPSAVTAGSIFVYTTSVGTACAGHAGAPAMTVAVPVGAPAGVLNLSATTLAAGSVYTVFLDGLLPAGGPTGTVLLPYHDSHP